MYDASYELKYTVTSEGLHNLADMHDFVTTPNGTALLVTYEQVSPWDTTSVGGKPDDEIMDAVIQERDIATGDVLFTWRLSDHYAINETMVTYADYGMRPGGGGFDFGHVNAVSKTAEGNYLASFRHLCAILLVGPDGNILWSLGGRRATDFCYQHDARFVNPPRTEITLFDNAHMSTAINRTLDRDCSRGLHLRLDYEEMTAEVLREYYHPSRVVAAAMGGVQTLGNGNKLIAWGFQPSITEHTAEGRVVMSLQLGPLVNDGQGKGGGKGPQVYRAKKVKWVGRPGWGPSIAGYPRGSERGVYLSWNGATEVAGWAVRLVRAGFETFAPLEASPRYVRAAAVDKEGNILGSTDAVDMDTGEVVRVNGTVTQVVDPGDVNENDMATGKGGAEGAEGDMEGAATGRLGSKAGGEVWMVVAGLSFLVCLRIL
ncbi:ASST-domain-containing protein [Hypoxylon fragiforme]|uniref:ASST-domain-containing protein n=1 Tax=Hypoxylon fragiforme TaxID=63214 RepID=UPI0020C72052|nr:ASST-domain-containing protein [Hypoxylon fragiforme]KAI2602915.1 ASST-domain-containing protein [Hypoxylon fragiforme]